MRCPTAQANAAAAQLAADAAAAAANGAKSREEQELARRRDLRDYEVATTTSNLKCVVTSLR